MHGRVKTRSTEEQQEIKKKERERKLKLYHAGMSRVFEKRKNGELDGEALEITEQLLTANPDIYTLWNIRREILIGLKNTSFLDDNDGFNVVMEGELQLTLKCLQANPKSYGGWHHREWVLDNMPKPNWRQELSLCSKYLLLDERNFHVWDHRRYVARRANILPTEELQFSTEKISTNFSNYSSWHYRSGLLPLIYPDPQGKRPIREEEHKEELELVQNACFTDPNDQSAWFYQRWLLGRSLQPLRLCQVVVSPDSVIIAFTQNVRLLHEGLNVTFVINGQYIEGVWASSLGVQSHVWGFYPNTELIQGDGECCIGVITLLKNNQVIDSMTMEVNGGRGIGLRKAEFGAGLSEGLSSILEEQLDSCQQLLEMEPDSKWTLLTSVLLMQAIDRYKYKTETMCKLDQLIKVDTPRAGYYIDLRSKFVMEYAIDKMYEEMCDKEATSNVQRELSISNLNLTALYHCHHLSFLLKLNLSSNKLFRSVLQLHHLQSCIWLCLDDNGIESLDGMPELPTLQTLLLRKNKIQSVENLCAVGQCPNISTLDLTGNPIVCDFLVEGKIKEILPRIKFLNDNAI